MESILALFLTDRSEEIDIRPLNPVSFVILLVPLFFLRRRGKSAGYLLCFSLFFLYLWAVVAYAVCPLPIGSDLVGWLRGEQQWERCLNLVPGVFLRTYRFWNGVDFYGNVLLGVPFGFGLPFVVERRNAAKWRVVALSFGLAAGLELVQLGISLVFYRFPYRSIDVDDVVLVFAGTMLGYGLLRASACVYRRLGWTGAAVLPVWGHFHAVLIDMTSPPATTHDPPRRNPSSGDRRSVPRRQGA